MRALGILIGLVLLLGLAACGDNSDDGSSSPPPPPADTESGDSDNDEVSKGGAAVFASAGCDGCHAFTAAGSTAVIGPNLDETALAVEQIEVQIREGSGAMPAFAELLSDEEIQALAEYVAGSS